MKNYILLFAMALGLSAAAPAFEALEIGAKAPKTDLQMKGTDGKTYTLAQLKKEKGLLVIFSCNTCPFVLGWEDQYPSLGKLAKEKKIGMVLVNSNEAKRKGDDSMSAMQEHYKAAGYNTPYVLDEKHVLADAFGARTTPHVYLFDQDMKLVYRGSINDKYENREKVASKQYLQNAMNQLSAGAKVEEPTTKEMGCTIKRV